MSGTEYKVQVWQEGGALWCWDVGCNGEHAPRAEGHSPYESTARRCADAVVSVLSGDGRNMYVDAMCKRDEAIAERDALRAELERVRETVADRCDRYWCGTCKADAALDEADHG